MNRRQLVGLVVAFTLVCSGIAFGASKVTTYNLRQNDWAAYKGLHCLAAANGQIICLLDTRKGYSVVISKKIIAVFPLGKKVGDPVFYTHQP